MLIRRYICRYAFLDRYNAQVNRQAEWSLIPSTPSDEILVAAELELMKSIDRQYLKENGFQPAVLAKSWRQSKRFMAAFIAANLLYAQMTTVIRRSSVSTFEGLFYFKCSPSEVVAILKGHEEAQDKLQKKNSR